MNMIIKEILSAILLTILIPAALFSTVPAYEPLQNSQPMTQIQQPDAPAVSNPVTVCVKTKSGAFTNMDIEEYVCGVVLGEMPASFETEALKAQAVAARTYALRCARDGSHENNAVCMEHTCCQAYCDPKQYIATGGRQSNLDKILSAVAETKGEVATYNGKLIFATYFASSGGQTEDAVAVWGRSFPYLVSVDSPGEQDKSYQNSKVTFTAKEFQEKLGISLAGTPKTWFGKVTYSDGGGVDKAVIGGKTYTGVKLRSLLGLRSTKFTVEATQSSVIIKTNGYGHRVGMSQYGADAMAVSGSNYKEILKHYYKGIEIVRYPITAD